MSSRIVGSLPVSEGLGCHDLTAHLPSHLLAAACPDNVRLYDISDAADPQLISVTATPLGAHSTVFSNDAESLVVGHEGQFYSEPATCLGEIGSPDGALWFYDISDPTLPVLRSRFSIPRALEPVSPGNSGCSAHYSNVVPTRNGRDVLITAWYGAGVNAIDFTDLDNPTEIAHYLPDRNAACLALVGVLVPGERVGNQRIWLRAPHARRLHHLRSGDWGSVPVTGPQRPEP